MKPFLLLGGVWLAGGVALGLAACSGPSEAPRVVVYTSLDQRFSEPVFRSYEAERGVRVEAAYDTEATKTTGLVNRLLAEKSSPRADVFWNSEIVRTIALKRAGVTAPYQSPAAVEIPPEFKDPEGYWTGFAARVRVLAVNTEMLEPADWPRSFRDLTQPRWRGRFAMAYPLFGTTSTHVAALFASWGPERTEAWLRQLAANRPEVVDGNSTARDRVAAGAVPVAMTDSDDVAVARSRGDPVALVFPDADGDGTLVIPNSVALIRNAPHPERAKAFIDYLLSPEVEVALSRASGAQIPLRASLPWPAALPPRRTLRPMRVDFERVADHLEESAAFCRELFVR